MKKILYILLVGVLCTSCYSTRIVNGSMDYRAVKVKTKRNHFLFWGLLPIDNEQHSAVFVGGKKNYIVETIHTFLDGLLNVVSFGIYTLNVTNIICL